MSILLLVLLLIAVGFIVFLLKNGGLSSRETIKILTEENRRLADQLQSEQRRYEQLRSAAQAVSNFIGDIKRRIPDFTTVSTLEDKVGLLQNYWNDYYDGEQLFRSTASDRFLRELYLKLKAWELVSELQNKVTTPFFEMLNEEQTDTLLVRERFIKMSMQLFDAISAFQSPNQRKREQGLNIGVFRGTMTEEQAFENAKVITDLEVETPLWIRNWARGLQGINLEDRNIIISGYKFPARNENGIDEP
jgi:hypothetical protein